MKFEAFIEEIKNHIAPALDHQQAELVEIELKGRSGNQVLRIFVDSEGGITLGQCEKISREISDILDQKDVFSGKYRLEVSSPGTDRPLKNYKDFRKNLNRQVQLNYFDQNGERRSITGRICNVNEEHVFIADKDAEFQISIEKIQTGKVITAWQK